MLSEQSYQSAADYIRSKAPQIPKTAIVLGSGLGGCADELQNPVVINYSDIPHFPKPTLTSHSGKMLIGQILGKSVLMLSGRTHFYEGYSMQEITFYIRVLFLLGVRRLIVTNAAGAVNQDFEVGQLMLIRDHIKFGLDSPTRGEHIARFGGRFFDMTTAYSPDLQAAARLCAERLHILLREGVYMYFSGPQFETPAEIRAARVLGADAVGMSTVPEVIAAAQCGIDVLGISLLTNMAAGMTGAPLSDDEVVEQAKSSGEQFVRLMKEIIKEIADS